MRRCSLGPLSGNCRPVRTSHVVLVRKISKGGMHCLLPGAGNNWDRGPEGGAVPDICEALRRRQVWLSL